jgi:hypothetical protein
MASAELIAALTTYVKPGASSVSTGDASFLESCADEAVALVARHAGTDIVVIPVSVLTRAYVEVASELYNRRSAPNGITQFAAPDGSAVRVARDPLVAAYPLLSPFMRPGIG